MINSVNPWQCLKALLRADFSVLLKNKRAVIISVLLPLVYLIVFSSNKAGEKLGGSAFIVAYSIAVGLISASLLGYALTIARDREKGIFQRLRVTPAPTWTIMVSRLLIQTVANLVIAAVVIVAGSLLFHLSLSVSDLFLVLLLSIIGGAVYLSLGQTLVGLIKSADLVNSTGRILFIILLLLGLLGPSGILGTAVQTIANWSPVGTVIAVLESALHQTVWSGHTSLALLACFAYILVFSAVGIKWFKWDVQ